MFTTRFVVSISSVAILVLGAGAVSGQAYPSKPIRIYTGSAGGSNDTTSRFVAAGISGPLGQPIVIENRAITELAAQAVSSSPPDGYSMVLAGDAIWLGPLLRGNPDAIRGLAPVTTLSSSPAILGVHPSLPVKSVKDLIGLAKARPGELNYSSGGPGAIDHIAPELFKSMTGTRIVGIYYKGAARAATAVASGETQMMFSSVASIMPHIKSGRVKALAVTSARPSALAAGLPTLAASGLPGFELVRTDAVYVPAKTPVAIVNRLNAEIVRFLSTKDAQEKFLTLEADVIANSPQEHLDSLNSRITILGKLIKDAGIKID